MQAFYESLKNNMVLQCIFCKDLLFNPVSDESVSVSVTIGLSFSC